VIDIVLSLLKFAAILIAGILGTAGLIVDYKKDGKITPWGRRALIGTIASTLVAVISQSIETYKGDAEKRAAEAKALEQAKYNAAVLNEIRRSIYPFHTINFGMKVKIPVPPPQIKKYLRRIAPYIKSHLKYVELDDGDHQPYLLLEEQELRPKAPSEDVASELVQPDFIIQIFKTQKQAACYSQSYPKDTYGCRPDVVLRPSFAGTSSISVGTASPAMLLMIWDIRANIDSNSGGGRSRHFLTLRVR
jgi:hypothetical protein